jgi:selenocysteine lyase/cysteine desulfurase
MYYSWQGIQIMASTIDWQMIEDAYPVAKVGVYLKNASMSGMHRAVIKAINDATTNLGAYATSDEAIYQSAYRETQQSTARFLKTDIENIALTSGTSFNMNIFAMMLKTNANQNIISHSDEFPSSILPFSHHGFEVKKVTTQNGCFNPLELLNLVDENTSAVVLSTIISTTGLRLDLKELAHALAEKEIPLILNATQSIGFFDLDLEALKVAAMSASVHKGLAACVGMAMAYMSPAFRQRSSYPLLGWASVENPFDLSIEPQAPRKDAAAIAIGSMPFSLMAGLNQAIIINEQMPRALIQARLLSLTRKLRTGLKDLAIDVIGSDQEENLSSITTFRVDDAKKVKDQLFERKIFVNDKRGLLRASVQVFNTPKDIDLLLQALKSLIKA